MATLSRDEVRELAGRYWTQPRDIAIATAIAWRESRFNTQAHNPIGKDNSYGLMQINMRGSLGVDRRARYGITNLDLYDPDTNMRIARRVWEEAGNSWEPWTTAKAALEDLDLSDDGNGGSSSGSWGDEDTNSTPVDDTFAPALSEADRERLLAWVQANVPEFQITWTPLEQNKFMIKVLQGETSIEVEDIPADIRTLIEEGIIKPEVLRAAGSVASTLPSLPSPGALAGDIIGFFKGLLPSIGWSLLVGLLAIAALVFAAKSMGADKAITRKMK